MNSSSLWLSFVWYFRILSEMNLFPQCSCCHSNIKSESCSLSQKYPCRLCAHNMCQQIWLFGKTFVTQLALKTSFVSEGPPRVRFCSVRPQQKCGGELLSTEVAVEVGFVWMCVLCQSRIFLVTNFFSQLFSMQGNWRSVAVISRLKSSWSSLWVLLQCCLRYPLNANLV